MMGQTSIARELLGRGTSQFQAVLGPMGLWYLGNGVPGWKCSHDGAAIPLPHSYGHSVLLDWKPT